MSKKPIGRPEVKDKKISKTVSILSSKYLAIVRHYGSLTNYIEHKTRYDKSLTTKTK